MGVGLIGGSLGLAIKKRKLAKEVIGFVRRGKTARLALQKKAVDRVSQDLKHAIHDADLIILSSPVSAIIQHLRVIRHGIKPSALVMDVGSSKAKIDQAAKKYLGKTTFIGCHPVAGSEKFGVNFSHAGLFVDTTCFMTRRNLRIEKFWRALGARPILITAKAHDKWAAQSSHLPHIISFALFQNFPHHKNKVANPSIRDLARLSKSNPKLWADILLSNRQEILPALDSFRANLGRWHRAINGDRLSEIINFIQEAKKHSL